MLDEEGGLRSPGKIDLVADVYELELGGRRCDSPPHALPRRIFRRHIGVGMKLELLGTGRSVLRGM